MRDFSGPSQEKRDVLDLMYGNGLVGAAIAPETPRLVGGRSFVLNAGQSPGTRHISTIATVGTGMDYAKGKDKSNDALVAADSFIYNGDLDNVMREVIRLLRRDGLFGFFLESLADPSLDYKLMPTTRYAYSLVYIEKLAITYGFRVHRQVPTTLRLEHERSVEGWIMLLGASEPDS